MAERSRPQRILLEALAEVPPHPVERPRRYWISRYLDDRLTDRGDSLHRRVDRIDTAEMRAAGKRNRMQYRHLQRALQALIMEGLVEHKDGADDDLYRLTPLGESEVAR